MNAVIYARYSSASQTEQSIEGQLRVCNEFAQANGYVIVGNYIDRAVSGIVNNRPQFLKMIEDSAKNQFDVVLVYQLDRFSRNRYDSAVSKFKLKKNGVKVLSVRENITDDASGVLLESLLEGMAEYYSRELSQKVKRGLKESAIKGTFTGGNVLLGYKIVAKRVEIDEKQAKVIQHVFNEFASGVPKKTIIDDLNARGFRTNKGAKFVLNSFYNTLRNRKYIGENVFNGVLSKHAYPQIISKDLFDIVQLKLDRKKHTLIKSKIDYILTGKAFCGHCNASIVGISGTSKSSAKHNYYACSNQYKKKTCSKRYEKKDSLEQRIVEQILTYIKNQDVFKTNNKIAPFELKPCNKIQNTKANMLNLINIFTSGDTIELNFKQKLIEIFASSIYVFDNQIDIHYNLNQASK